MKKLLYVLIGLCLLAGVFTSCEKPEKETEQANSTIKGIVTDKAMGKPLSGVTIEVQPVGKQVQTTEEGTYILENLKAGTYTLKAQKDGYIDYTKEEIQLVADQITTLNIEMLEDEYKSDADYTISMFGLNIEMVYVEGGEFEMGATAEQGDDARDDHWNGEYPVRTIKLDSYHIGKYEVTQAQWEKVMGTTLKEQGGMAGYDFQGYPIEGSDYPMCYVNWEDARAFCDSLSKQTGKKYVLPTEAQWEYAARGGNKSQHYKYAGSNDIEEVAWYGDYTSITISDGAHQVGTKKANELGIYDMSGNVWEWCLESHKSYDENDTINPQGPVWGGFVMNRGGCFNDAAVECRVSRRASRNSERRFKDLGFRVAVLP